MLYDIREVARWKNALKKDILLFQQKVDAADVPRITDWLQTQESAHKGNPHALRLAYTEALLVNLTLYIKTTFPHVEADLLGDAPALDDDTGTYLDPIHKATIKPAVEILQTAGGAAAAAAAQANDMRLGRLQKNYDKLSADYTAQSRRLEELVQRQERVERELREERHELCSLRAASNRQKRDDAERSQRLAASLEEEAKKNQILTNMLNNSVEKQIDLQTETVGGRSSGLHRLFSGRGRSVGATTKPTQRRPHDLSDAEGFCNLDRSDSGSDAGSDGGRPSPKHAFGSPESLYNLKRGGSTEPCGDDTPAAYGGGVGEHRAQAMAAARRLQNEVMEELFKNHPDMPQEDKEAICWDVAQSVAKLMPPLEELQNTALGQVEGKVRKFRNSISMGKNLYGQTREATEKLQGRIKHLEQQLEGRQRRIRELENAINSSLSDEQKILTLQRDLDDAVSGHNKLQSLLDGKLDACEDFDKYLSDELRSMRDAFSIKLGLANQQVENMQKQHLEQIRKLAAEGEAERNALRQQIVRLQAGRQ